jgi:hypothetical protein
MGVGGKYSRGTYQLRYYNMDGYQVDRPISCTGSENQSRERTVDYSGKITTQGQQRRSADQEAEESYRKALALGETAEAWFGLGTALDAHRTAMRMSSLRWPVRCGTIRKMPIFATRWRLASIAKDVLKSPQPCAPDHRPRENELIIAFGDLLEFDHGRVRCYKTSRPFLSQ